MPLGGSTVAVASAGCLLLLGPHPHRGESTLPGVDNLCIVPGHSVVGTVGSADPCFRVDVPSEAGTQELCGDIVEILVESAGEYELELRSTGFSGFLGSIRKRDVVHEPVRSIQGVVRMKLEAYPGEGLRVLAGARPGSGGPYVLHLRYVPPHEVGADAIVLREIRPPRDFTPGIEFGSRLLELLVPAGLDSSTALVQTTHLAERLAEHNEHEQALALLQEALSTFPEEVDSDLGPPAIFALASLAELLRYRGGASVAEIRRLLEQALENAERPGIDPRWRALILAKLGNHMLHLGDARSALVLLDASLDASDDLELGESVGRLKIEPLIDRALALARLAQNREALESTEEAMRIAQEELGEDHLRLHLLKAERARLLLRIDPDAEVSELLESARARLESDFGDDHPYVAGVLCDLGTVHARKKAFVEALSITAKALVIAESWWGADHVEAAEIRMRLARWHALSGNTERAWKEAQRALEAWEITVGLAVEVLSEREALLYIASHRAALDLVLELDALIGSETSRQRAYRALSFWKGRVSRGLLALHRDLRKEASPEVNGLLIELQAVRAALSRAALKQMDSRVVYRVRERRDELERRLSALRSSGGERGSKATHRVARSRLSFDSALIDAFVYRRTLGNEPTYHLGVWVTTADQDPTRIELGALSNCEEAARDYLGSLGVPALPRGVGSAVPTGSATKATPDQVAERLRTILWEPLEPLVAGKKTLFISPDGFLGAFPLQVLQREDESFLIEHYRLTYIPDAGALLGEGHSESGLRCLEPMLIVGGVRYDGGFSPGTFRPHALGPLPPLPGSLEEAQSIADLHSRLVGPEAERLVLKGFDPTEERLRLELPSYPTVHIASHAITGPWVSSVPIGSDEGLRAMPAGFGADLAEELSEELPGALAGIVCAPTQGGNDEFPTDGILTAEEISWLDLSGLDLVVLSACSSGAGTPKLGEGLLGLRRAFHQAGARDVVSAVWPVADAPTADLMVAFYEHLWSGQSPADALRSAQLDRLAQTRAQGSNNGNPELWGAFILDSVR